MDNHNPDPATRDALEVCLHKHRVHDGFPQQRRALAVQCELHAITCEDIDLLADSIAAQRRKDSDGAPAILFSLLKDAKACKERIADIRRGHAVRPQVVARVHPGELDRKRSLERLREERDEWRDKDREHYIRCRAADGVPRDVADAEWSARSK